MKCVTKTHVLGACHRASLITRLGAELTRYQELEPDGSPRLESAWPSGTRESAWTLDNRDSARPPVQLGTPRLLAAQPPAEFGTGGGTHRAADSPESRNSGCAGIPVGGHVPGSGAERPRESMSLIAACCDEHSPSSGT